MKNVKRALAMCLTLALLLSCSPVFNVSATGTESESDALSAYKQLMRNYILDNSQSDVGISGDGDNKYIKDENGCLTFGNVTEGETASGYASLLHGLEGTKLIFEAEFCCVTPGFAISFQANKNTLGDTVEIMSFSGKTLSFSGSDVKVTFESDRWYKITFAYDLESHRYDAFVDGEQKVDDGTTQKQLDTLTRIRAIISSKTTTAGGKFQIQNVNWYRESAYRQLMEHYKVAASDDISDSTNTLLSKEFDGIRQTDDAGNHYLKFSATAAGKYVNANHKLESNPTKIIFEADIRWDNPGLQIVFNARTQNMNLVYLQNGTLNFKSPDGDTVVNLSAGEWHTITYAMDFDAGTFSAFVNREQVVDNKNVVSGFSSIAAIRFSILAASGTDVVVSDDKDFYIDNVKWYVYRECADNDYDGLCDYGCGKETYHQYKIEDSKIIDENGNEVPGNEIKASSVLNLNGQNATIKVTGENTVLSVVDTSFMLDNGNLDLSGENASKLTLADGSTGKIADWTQYGDYKYLKVENKNENGEPDGTYSFHPFNLVFTRIGLNTVKEAVCVQVTFIANDVVRELLMDPDNDYGLRMLADNPADVCEKSAKEKEQYWFVETSHGVRAYFDLTGTLTEEKFDTTREFKAYIKIGDTEIVSNYTAVINPKAIMETLNNSDINPTAGQLTRIRAMMEKYEHLANVLTRFKEEA